MAFVVCDLEEGLIILSAKLLSCSYAHSQP